MAEVEEGCIVIGAAAEFEEQWEFDAPRFHDFEQSTPPGESADDWFDTSATKGLVTPTGVKPNTKDVNVVNEEYLEISSQMVEENLSQLPPSQKTNVSSQPDPGEAEQVRAVLAHITNNTTSSQQGAGAALIKKPAPKVDTKPKKQKVAEKSAKPAQEKQQQKPKAPVPSKAKAVEAVTAAENKAVPFPAPAVAPSRPATRAMDKTTSRTTRSTAMGAPASTRAREPPRVRAPSTKVVAAKNQQQQRSKPQITVAKSPFLRSKQRSTTHRQQTKTTEELELEKVEKAKKEAAALRRRNARSVGPALQGRSLTTTTTAGPSRPPKRAQNEPTREFNLRTAKRQRVNDGMQTRHGAAASALAAPSPWKSTAQRVAEFTTGVSKRQTQKRPAPRGRQQQRGRAELTVPRTPRFATKTRARAPRFKPTEEEEAEKAANEANALKMRQKKAAEANRNPPAALPRRSERRRPLTEFKPFSFATDVRAAQRSTKPAAELPPFVFGAEDNGPVTRSRAHLVTTTAPGAAPRSSRRERTLLQQQHNVDYGNLDHDDYRQQQQQRPGSGDSNEAFTLGGARTRRRTTAGPMLLGGAVRVLRQEQQQDEEAEEQAYGRNMARENSSSDDDDECCTEEQDGMQAIIRAGATAGIDRTTLHNPLFHA